MSTMTSIQCGHNTIDQYDHGLWTAVAVTLCTSLFVVDEDDIDDYAP